PVSQEGSRQVAQATRQDGQTRQLTDPRVRRGGVLADRQGEHRRIVPARGETDSEHDFPSSPRTPITTIARIRTWNAIPDTGQVALRGAVSASSGLERFSERVRLIGGHFNDEPATALQRN